MWWGRYKLLLARQTCALSRPSLHVSTVLRREVETQELKARLANKARGGSPVWTARGFTHEIPGDSLNSGPTLRSPRQCLCVPQYVIAPPFTACTLRPSPQILKNAAKLKAASSNVEGDDTGGPEPPAAAAKLSAYEKGNSAVHPRSPRRGAVSPDRAERVKSSELTRKFHVDYQQYLATLAEQQAQRSREEQQEIARVQALRAALAKAVRRRLAETKNKVGELGGAVQPGSAGAPSAPLTRPSTLDSSSSRRFSSPRRMHRPPAALDIHCEDDAEEGVSVTRPSASARGTSSFHRSASVERPGASPSGESSSPADSGAASPSPLAGAASALAGGSFSKLQVGPPPSSRSSRVVERLFEVAREANQLAMARSTEEARAGAAALET